MRNLPHGFEIYLVTVKTVRKIAQMFVAFSEKLNFTLLSKLSKASHVQRASAEQCATL